MRLKVVLQRCKELGYDISASGLYQAGHTHGFLNKQEKGRGLDFDKEKFEKWIAGASKEIKPGYMTLAEIAKKSGYTVGRVWQIVQELPETCKQKIGTGKGVLYVHYDTFIDNTSVGKVQKEYQALFDD